MLLKDCPVGSVVRLVSLRGEPVNYPWWDGDFIVEQNYRGNFITDNDGTRRQGVYNNPDYQFEIVQPAPQPRITFTVGGQEFYVGQRVWTARDIKSDTGAETIYEGFELEVCAISRLPDTLILRRVDNMIGLQAPHSNISTTPPSPHEWKRGDWARHEIMGNGWVTGFARGTGPDAIVPVSFNETVDEIRASELTFISHSEPPK